jgi:hypothetical protein
MLFGCISKIMHWPGASIMIIVSVFLFCFWFLPVGLMNSYASLPIKKMKTLHIVSFFVFFVCMMGVLFKVMHWPGAGMFLLPGLMMPFVVFLPVYLYHTRDEEKTGNKNFFALTIGLIFLAVFSVFLAMTISKQVIRQDIALIDLNEKETRVISVEQTDNSISKAASDLFTYADELKCIILSSTDPEMCTGNKPNDKYNYENMFVLDQVRNIFASDEGASQIKTLKEKITIFRETVLADKNISPELAELTKTLFDLSDADEYGNDIPGEWERREIHNYPMVFVLDFLSKLQNNVRLVEGEALK